MIRFHGTQTLAKFRILFEVHIYSGGFFQDFFVELGGGSTNTKTLCCAVRPFKHLHSMARGQQAVQAQQKNAKKKEKERKAKANKGQPKTSGLPANAAKCKICMTVFKQLKKDKPKVRAQNRRWFGHSSAHAWCVCLCL
jgi:hypothetical protein